MFIQLIMFKHTHVKCSLAGILKSWKKSDQNVQNSIAYLETTHTLEPIDLKASTSALPMNPVPPPITTVPRPFIRTL